MNIKQAKSIPIKNLLDKLGLSPSKQTPKELWYLSPFRAENTPSFHINPSKNIWYDFGEGQGGDVLSFVSKFLETTGENATIVDVLRWLRNMEGSFQFQPIERLPKEKEQASESWKVQSSDPISHPALVQYLQSRGIELTLAKSYLLQVHVKSNQRKRGYFALGLQNEEGGYEVRNQFFKGSVSPKSIRFIRGTKPKPEAIHLFEGFMDFLSAVSQLKNKALSGDAIILNSLSNLNHALPYMKNYGYRTLYSWMDNDPAGERAIQALTDFCASEEGLIHVPMNKLYRNHKDVNDWHVSRLNISQQRPA